MDPDRGRRRRHTPRRAQGARALKAHWLRLAAAHVERGGEGIFGYNLFSISKRDLAKAKQIHLRYYRELQELVARSKPNEHVALFAAQLFRLDRG
jgi:hypothetical protein